MFVYIFHQNVPDCHHCIITFLVTFLRGNHGFCHYYHHYLLPVKLDNISSFFQVSPYLHANIIWMQEPRKKNFESTVGKNTAVCCIFDYYAIYYRKTASTNTRF